MFLCVTYVIYRKCNNIHLCNVITTLKKQQLIVAEQSKSKRRVFNLGFKANG